MKYMLMIYEDESVYADDGSGQVLSGIVEQHMELVKELGPAMVSGSGLKPAATATVVRTSARVKTIHDGPFAEAREQLGGYYVIDVPDLDAAVAIARKVPLAADGAIEVRPLENY